MFRERFEDCLENIRMSPIVSVSEEVRLRAQDFEESGKSMIRFQRGEIDLGTPDYIIEAAKRALSDGYTKYPKSGGEDILRSAIVAKLKRDHGITDLAPENIVVTYGGQEGLELAFKLFSSGAGFSPTWSCALENFVPYAGIEFSEVPLNDDFSVDYNLLHEAIRGKDFFYLNNPQNPTGKVFSRGELDTIVDICTQNGCYIISDEAYEKFVYDGHRHHSLTEYKQENILSVFTLSKTFAMTGWRVGYVVARNPRIAKLLRLGNYTQTAGVTTFIQHAAAKALDDHQSADHAIGRMKTEFQKRRNALFNGLKDLIGVKLAQPQGAFYMFPNFSEVIPKGTRGKKRERYIYELLMEHGIASVYGSCFGKHFVDNVRLSFSATPVPVIEDAVERFRNIFAKKTTV